MADAGKYDFVTFAPKVGTTASITAAGSAQGDAAALTGAVNLVTGADGTKGVILPEATVANGRVGTSIFIQNITAAALLVYPYTGGTVSGASANASVSIASGSNVLLFCTSANTWHGLEAPKA